MCIICCSRDLLDWLTKFRLFWSSAIIYLVGFLLVFYGNFRRACKVYSQQRDTHVYFLGWNRKGFILFTALALLLVFYFRSSQTKVGILFSQMRDSAKDEPTLRPRLSSLLDQA